MKKKIIDVCASFFFELPEKHSVFEKEKRKYLLEQLEKEYPSVDEKIIWGYCIFTFEKKKFALVSVINREIYEEKKVKYSSYVFTSEIAVIASRASFVKENILHKTATQKVFYDKNLHEPKILFTDIGKSNENISIEKSFNFSEKDIQNAKPIFNENYKKKRIKYALSILVFAFLLFLVTGFFSFQDFSPKTENILIEQVEVVKKEEQFFSSSFSSFLCLSNLFRENNFVLETFTENENGFIVFKTKTDKPSVLLEKLIATDLFQNVSITSMQKDAGSKKFDCTFELYAKNKPTSSILPPLSAIERITSKVPALKNAQTTLKGFQLETTADGLRDFLTQYADFEQTENIFIKDFFITSNGSKIIAKGNFAFDDSIHFIKPAENDFENICSIFPSLTQPVLEKRSQNTKTQPEQVSDKTEIARIRNPDGSVTVYKKNKDGKIQKD